MAEPSSWTEVMKNWAETVAIVVGGGWTFWQFLLKRQYETALEIDLELKFVPLQDRVLTYFDVKLTNKAIVRVRAKPARMPAYRDGMETLKYSGDLLVRAVKTDTPSSATVSWFADPSAPSPAPGDIETDLLYDYEIEGRTDFWMEPKETYHVGAALMLAPGTYLAMVTFVGTRRRDTEFWRRVFFVQVPDPKKTLLAG